MGKIFVQIVYSIFILFLSKVFFIKDSYWKTKKDNFLQVVFFIIYIANIIIHLFFDYYFFVVEPKPPSLFSLASSSKVMPYSTNIP